MGETYNFFAFQKSDGRMVGGCQFWLVQRHECQRTSMGYWIFNNYWKQGFGFELANGLISHGLKKMKLNRIEAEILPDNTPSIELSKKLGMTFEGIRRNSMYFDGSWHDHAIYAITADDIGIVNRKPEREFTDFV
jgi:ribosomal-protein-alanine N-acetyltransferase